MNQTALNKIYSKKQQIALSNYYNNKNLFMLINHGAVRTGKTHVDNDIFLSEIIRIHRYAEENNLLSPLYILAGASIGNIEKNVLTPLRQRYGLNIKLDKYNSFSLMGVRVCCVGHDDKGRLSNIVGMTSFGAYINEGSLAHKDVFDEILKRNSAAPDFTAKIIVDTNPDSPVHYLKTDYIDKADNKRIFAQQWELEDNTFLSKDYIDNMKNTTPSGVFFDRKIKGLWVSADGVVYLDYAERDHLIDEISSFKFERYFCGVDWGYEHYGSICLFGVVGDTDILIEEITEQHKLIDFWKAEALKITDKYGKNIPFYCDSARPDNITTFRQSGIWALNADKNISPGIECVAKRFKERKLLIYRKGIKLFNNQIHSYCWDTKSGLPIKIDDDVMDAVRYGIYSDDIKYHRAR